MSGLPERIGSRLRLPLIVAPMLYVSGPELVAAACEAGAIGAFPTANPGTAEELDRWLSEIEDAAGLSVRERARMTMERRLTAGWRLAADRAGYRRLLSMAPNAAHLPEALRQIARAWAHALSDRQMETGKLPTHTDAHAN